MKVKGFDRESQSLWMVAVSALVLGLGGCAVPMDADQLAGGALSGVGGPCLSTDSCDFGLRCLQRSQDKVCVQPCSGSGDCGSGICNPVPGSSAGWCHFDETGFLPDEGDHSPPTDDERSPAPPDDDSAPPVDDPPADDPGWEDDPQEDPNPDQEPGFTDPSDPDPEPDAQPQPCTFSPGSSLSRNGVVPDWSWSGAYDGNGNTRDFSFRSFACDPEFDGKSILVFMISAGWCGPCGDYMRNLRPQLAQIEAAGATVVIMEVEDRNYSPASNATANQIINNYIPNGAIRLGDADTRPSARSVYNSNIVSSFPQVIVVRRSDMRIVTDQNSSGTYLDFAALARQYAGDGGGNNNNPPNESCEEEQYEPNDSTSNAAPISPGSFSAGVCGSDSDYYRINVNGFWRLDLNFRHSVGDIDVYVWDTNTNQPARDFNNRNIGSDSGTDNESFTHVGPAIIRVLGYEGARAPYTLTLTEQ